MTATIPQNGQSHTVNIEMSTQESLKTQIKKYLPNLSPEQLQQFAEQLEKQEKLQAFFKAFPEQSHKFDLHTRQINKWLNYKEPFKVAIVAVTGTGKSTLLNSMLARDLVLVKNVGGAATGCALYLHQTVAEGDPERAIVKYRTEENICELVKTHFIDEYALNGTMLSEGLHEGLVSALLQATPKTALSQDEQRTFDELKETLVDLVKQYIRCNRDDLKTDFNLDNARDRERLLTLTDEGSSGNQNGQQRIIGLIEAVDYYVRSPQKNQRSHSAHQAASESVSLTLPDNVCLVDLPGLDGTCLHNIIIREGIEAADAVLFVVHPRRFQTLSNTDLLNRISQFVSGDRTPQAGDRIFLVINAKDEITAEIKQALPKIRDNANQFLEKISPGSSEHAQQFIVSAWAALQAQKAIKGDPIAAADKYAGVQRALGVAEGDHQAVLAESSIPQLIESLNNFVKDCTARQIKTARHEIVYVMNALTDDLEHQKMMMTQGEGDRYHYQRISRVLEKHKEDAEWLVESFRRTQIVQLPALTAKLLEVANILCDEVDNSLQAKIPQYWKDNFSPGTYRPSAEDYAVVKYQPFLGEVELALWRLLSIKVQSLAQEISRSYELGLQAFELCERVANCGFGKISAEVMKNALLDSVEELSTQLLQSVRGFAIGSLADPSRQFISFSETNDEKQSTLLTVLEQTIPFDRELEPNHFHEFVNTVRNHYSPSVHQHCLTQLVNLYRYEMIRVEDRLLAFVREQFEQLRRNNSLTLAEITDDLDIKSEWIKLEDINRQLELLKQMGR